MGAAQEGECKRSGAPIRLFLHTGDRLQSVEQMRSLYGVSDVLLDEQAATAKRGELNQLSCLLGLRMAVQ